MSVEHINRRRSHPVDEQPVNQPPMEKSCRVEQSSITPMHTVKRAPSRVMVSNTNNYNTIIVK